MENAQRAHSDQAAASQGLAASALDLLRSMGHSAIQNTYNGIAQLVDLTGLHLPEMHAFDLAPASGWMDKAAQTVGGGLGMVIPYFGIAKLTDGLTGASAVDRAESLSLVRRAITNPVVRAGFSGAVYSGLLLPVDQKGKSFWAARADNALLGGATFAALTGGSELLGKYTSGFATGGFARTAKGILITGAAGIPAGIVSAEGQSLITDHKLTTNVVGSAANYAVLNLALSGLTRGYDALASGRSGTIAGASNGAEDSTEAGVTPIDTAAGFTDSAFAKLTSTPDLTEFDRMLDDLAKHNSDSAIGEQTTDQVPEANTRGEPVVQIVREGTIERDSSTGKITKVEGQKGTYTYEWNGDQLTRVTTPRWTYDRQGDSAEWLTYAKKGIPHFHTYDINVEDDGTFVRHNLQLNRIEREQMNGDATTIYSEEEDPAIGERTLQRDGNSMMVFRDGRVEYRDANGELLDGPPTESRTSIPDSYPVGEPASNAVDPLEKLYALESVEPTYARGFSDSNSALPEVEEIDGAIIRRDPSTGKILEIKGSSDQTRSFEWNGDQLTGVRIPGGMAVLDPGTSRWSGSFSSGPKAPPFTVDVSSSDGSVSVHDLFSNRMYVHKVNGDYTVIYPPGQTKDWIEGVDPEEELGEIEQPKLQQVTHHASGFKTVVYQDGTSALVNPENVIQGRFGADGQPVDEEFPDGRILAHPNDNLEELYARESFKPGVSGPQENAGGN